VNNEHDENEGLPGTYLVYTLNGHCLAVEVWVARLNTRLRHLRAFFWCDAETVSTTQGTFPTSGKTTAAKLDTPILPRPDSCLWDLEPQDGNIQAPGRCLLYRTLGGQLGMVAVSWLQVSTCLMASIQHDRLWDIGYKSTLGKTA